jgi:exopolysaccharide biosynthesis WecB/TagA/CpsF family protein
MLAARNLDGYGARMNAFDALAPDGQPVRWALNFFHKTGLGDRVYGPEFTLRCCDAASKRGVPIYLYGSAPEVIEKLAQNLLGRFPALQIAGKESPPYRSLTPQENEQVIQRINASGAKLLFLGIGCPKQEDFAFAHRKSIKAVQLCVGAAFDFHAGTKSMAPRWMQKRGLEWLYRLCCEPRRLWKRYLVTNTMFIIYFIREWILGSRPIPASGSRIDELDAVPFNEP